MFRNQADNCGVRPLDAFFLSCAVSYLREITGELRKKLKAREIDRQEVAVLLLGAELQRRAYSLVGYWREMAVHDVESEVFDIFIALGAETPKEKIERAFNEREESAKAAQELGEIAATRLSDDQVLELYELAKGIVAAKLGDLIAKALDPHRMVVLRADVREALAEATKEFSSHESVLPHTTALAHFASRDVLDKVAAVRNKRAEDLGRAKPAAAVDPSEAPTSEVAPAPKAEGEGIERAANAFEAVMTVLFCVISAERWIRAQNVVLRGLRDGRSLALLTGELEAVELCWLQLCHAVEKVEKAHVKLCRSTAARFASQDRKQLMQSFRRLFADLVVDREEENAEPSPAQQDLVEQFVPTSNAAESGQIPHGVVLLERLEMDRPNLLEDMRQLAREILTQEADGGPQAKTGAIAAMLEFAGWFNARFAG